MERTPPSPLKKKEKKKKEGKQKKRRIKKKEERNKRKKEGKEKNIYEIYTRVIYRRLSKKYVHVCACLKVRFSFHSKE